MANGLFDSYKEQALQNTCDLDDSIKFALVDAGTVDPVLATHDFYDDITSAVQASTAALANKTFTDGTFDNTANVVASSVSGNTVEDLTMYNDTPGTEATKDLILNFDTGVTGLPLTPNGGDVTLSFDASGIFSI